MHEENGRLDHAVVHVLLQRFEVALQNALPHIHAKPLGAEERVVRCRSGMSSRFPASNSEKPVNYAKATRSLATDMTARLVSDVYA
jgi:hypothetical protein